MANEAPTTTSVAPVSAAPPVPNAGLRPPPTGARARANSAGSADTSTSSSPAAPFGAAPGIGGLFAGGIPKLRTTKGGINTGGTCA